MTEKYRDYKAKSDAEIIKMHDDAAPYVQLGVRDLLTELALREQARQTRAMQFLTRVIAVWTAVNTIFVAVTLYVATK
ncbi:MAG TPA: hypothetical protein VFB69_05370 [Candidatus Dormibacteraeota bacterium]|nr:hypothetical protein [Candidatus Dormibacteraeota bacterium]